MDHPMELIEIIIQSLTGRKIDFLVSSQETILCIKARVQRTECIPVNQQHLVWRGMELHNSHSLKHYGIQSRAVIKLVLSLKGGPISTKRLQLDEPKIHEMVEYLAEAEDSLSTSSSSSSLLNDSSKTSSKKRVTVIVCQRGGRLSFYKVLERGTSSEAKIHPAEASTATMLSKYDEFKKMRERLNEDGKTKSKMLLLKSQIKKMAAKKTKSKEDSEQSAPQDTEAAMVAPMTSDSSALKSGDGDKRHQVFYSPPNSYLRHLNQKSLLHHFSNKYISAGLADALKPSELCLDAGVARAVRVLQPLQENSPPSTAAERTSTTNLPSLNLKMPLDRKAAFLTSNEKANAFVTNDNVSNQSSAIKDIFTKHPRVGFHHKLPPLTTSNSICSKSPIPPPEPPSIKPSKHLKSLPPLKTSPKHKDVKPTPSQEAETWKDSSFYKHMKDCLFDFEGKDWDLIYRRMMMSEGLLNEKKRQEDTSTEARKTSVDSLDTVPIQTISQLSRKKSLSPQPDKYLRGMGKKVCRTSSITELKVAPQAPAIETHSNERFFKNMYPVLPPISVSKQAINTACEPVASDSSLSSNLSEDSSLSSSTLCGNYNTYTYRSLSKEYDLTDDDDEEEEEAEKEEVYADTDYDNGDDDKDGGGDDDDDDDDGDVDDEDDDDYDENNLGYEEQSLNLARTLLSPEIEKYRSQLKMFFQDKLNVNFPLLSNTCQENDEKTSDQTETKVPILPNLQNSLSIEGTNQPCKPQASGSKGNSNKRCFVCRKKTPLATSFVCRCEKSFCTIHRYPESHNCNFDFKFEGRKALKENSPVVAAPKLPKI